MSTSNYSVVEHLDSSTGLWNQCSFDAVFEVPKSYHEFLGEKTPKPFWYQSYALAAFIAGVRNYSAISPIAEGRGLPARHEENVLEEVGCWYARENASPYPVDITENYAKTWVLLSELLDFDYDKTFEDRNNSMGRGDPLPIGEGKVMSYREFLPSHFFSDLKTLSKQGNPCSIRIVWAFD